jgi:2-oxoglutarate dehydrogenase E2 component (dihydrolipoamide succinyltransferase)
MAHAVKIPAVGESITEGTLSRWLVADGAVVTDSTPLFELETDKISTEVQSGVAGKVTFKAKEGEVLAIGTVVAEIDTMVVATVPAAKSAPAPTVTATAAPAAAAPKNGPAADKALAESGVDPATISGTGKDGRITKGDVAAATAAPRPAPATPAPAAAPLPAATAPAPVAASGGGVSRKRMTPLRQRIAQRLVQAQHTAAILTTFNEVDMTAAMDLRKKWKEDFEKKHGTGLGFMSIFSIAAVKALQKFPGINSQIDGTDVVSFDHINLGIAVGTEKGLVVPVLKHAENMGFADVEKAIRSYALKAREGKLAVDDMQGGTFTITNGGTYGSLMSTPIINPPQSGILGMHAIKDRPMAVNGQVVIRPMMYIALSYDHRIVDGAEAVGFLVRIKELVEAPERMLLGL